MVQGILQARPADAAAAGFSAAAQGFEAREDVKGGTCSWEGGGGH